MAGCRRAVRLPASAELCEGRVDASRVRNEELLPVRLTAAYTGLAQPDAERRVDEVAARAKENISRARRSAVVLALMIGAAAMAAASWFAACAGGCVRDDEVSPHALLDWGKASEANLGPSLQRHRTRRRGPACTIRWCQGGRDRGANPDRGHREAQTSSRVRWTAQAARRPARRTWIAAADLR
jgi:hypothetical protein